MGFPATRLFTGTMDYIFNLPGGGVSSRGLGVVLREEPASIFDVLNRRSLFGVGWVPRRLLGIGTMVSNPPPVEDRSDPNENAVGDLAEIVNDVIETIGDIGQAVLQQSDTEKGSIVVDENTQYTFLINGKKYIGTLRFLRTIAIELGDSAAVQKIEAQQAEDAGTQTTSTPETIDDPAEPSGDIFDEAVQDLFGVFANVAEGVVSIDDGLFSDPLDNVIDLVDDIGIDPGLDINSPQSFDLPVWLVKLKESNWPLWLLIAAATAGGLWVLSDD